MNKYELDEVYISDINAELINVYRIIRDEPESLIATLGLLQSEFLPMDIEHRKDFYLTKRTRFNELKSDSSGFRDVEKAALMIFLNKTCFNGLYRVNRKSLFNVPMGSYKNPVICDEKNLWTVSRKLKKVTIVCGDYRKSANFIDNHTFVYLDPPYRPITNTSSFVSYTERQFDDEEQCSLAAFVDEIQQKGAKVVISNSDPKNTNTADDFFDKLYAAYKIKRIDAARMINCNGNARGKIKELLISTF